MMTMKLMTNGRKAILAGVALVACLGFTLNAQAQCTVTNWQGGQTVLTDADAGTPDDGHRRYGGPCSVEVPAEGTAAYVSDNSPLDETAYIARFYVYVGDAGGSDTMIFAAQDDGTNVIQVHYNDPAAGDITMYAFDSGAGQASATFTASEIDTDWVSIEFDWSAGTDDKLFSVNGLADKAIALDTSGIGITDASLGNINGADSGAGSVFYFDDFDSRRQNRPGRLLLADSNDDGTVDIFDVQATGGEVVGGALAAGQPDCNEDGSINIFDVQCTGAIVTGS
jgi:hypothetical protein